MAAMTEDLSNLRGRRILLGVTGGIAAYKAADLCRRLGEVGATVQVVMTEGAEHFIGATTFQALTGHAVRQSLWDAAAEAAMGHIELARWADLILIAPCSANTMARLACGLADDLLTTLCLATDRPLAIAPAMNRLMWAHPATQANLATLRERGVHVLGPGSGFQACGEVGAGRMREPLELRSDIATLLQSSGQPLTGLRAVVTAGPTREPLDPVRFITNRSSGKQGYAIAQALRELGAEVTLVSGPTALEPVPGVRMVAIETAEELLAACRAFVGDAQLFIAAAAVADYRAASIARHKIKKNDAQMSVALERTQDVLATIRAENPALFVVGFAAETQELEKHARDKLKRKNLDMIAANQVGDGLAFDRDDNELHVYWSDGGTGLARASKLDLARALSQLIAERYAEKTSRTQPKPQESES